MKERHLLATLAGFLEIQKKSQEKRHDRKKDENNQSLISNRRGLLGSVLTY